MSDYQPTLREIVAAHGDKREYERYLFLSRYAYRPVGFLLTWVATRIGLTGEAVSWLSLCVGLVGLAGLAQPSTGLAVAGLILLHLFNLLDCTDGSIARVMRTQNSYGRFLDSLCGGLVDIPFWAVAGVLAFHHPLMLSYPDGFGFGRILWLAIGGVTCLLSVALGYVERTYEELLNEEWILWQKEGRASTDGSVRTRESSPIYGLRLLLRNFRVRETHYFFLTTAWLCSAVDVLLFAYSLFYSFHIALVTPRYIARGRILRSGARYPGTSIS